MGQLTMLKDFKSLPAIEKAIRLAGGISTLANELSVTNTTSITGEKSLSQSLLRELNKSRTFLVALLLEQNYDQTYSLNFKHLEKVMIIVYGGRKAA
nr:hypothetical protein [Piscirickettsia salmonis]